MAKVSVILPTYNRPFFVAAAIQSVLNQSLQDFELIVVDDASMDSTREIVNQFKDKRIKYIRHEINKGEAASRNTGILNSTGEYIALLDDDDEWFPDKLKVQVDCLQKRYDDVGCIYCGLIFVHRTDNRILRQIVPNKKGNIYKEMVSKNVIDSPSSVVIKRQCFEKVGLFDEDLPYFVDYDFFLRVSKFFSFDYIERPLLIYYVHEGQLSNDVDVIKKGLEALQKKYSQANGFGISFQKIYSRFYFQMAFLYCERNDFTKGREALKKAMLSNPLNYKIYFQLLFTLFGYKNYTKLRRMASRLLQTLKRRLIAKSNQINIS